MTWSKAEIEEFMEKHSDTNWKQMMAKQIVDDIVRRGGSRDEAIERVMHINIMGDVWVVLAPER